MSFVLARVLAIRRFGDGRAKTALRRQLRTKRAVQRAGSEDAVDLALRAAHLRRREGVEQPAQQRRLQRRRWNIGNGRVVGIEAMRG